MDMLHGAIGGKLFRFSLPIALTGVAEQFFNSVDVMILGQFVGKEAMAAVGNDIPAVIALGVVRVHYVTGLEFINGFLDILSGTMRGYGFSLPPAVVTLIGVCGIRITWLHTYFPAHPDFAGLMLNYPVSWAVTAALLGLVYWYYRREVLAPRRESAHRRPR